MLGRALLDATRVGDAISYPGPDAILRSLVEPSRARMVVATIESLVHRLIAALDPVDPKELEDELVVLLTGYLVRQDLSG